MKVGAVIWASLLHIAALLALIVVLPWRVQPPPAAAMAVPIEGVIIDTAAIKRERAKQDEAARQERLQQQREERQRREADEQQRAAEQREQQRVAAEQRARDDAKRKEEQRLADERAEQARKKQEAEAQARRDREEAAARERERAAQKQREEEMQLAAAAEAEANAARAAGLLDQYQLMIQNHVKRYWDRPLSARPGIECIVNVVQLPTGDVVSAKVTQCNGDEAVRRSIENAVVQASPLPRPPTQAVFSRNFTITFAPDK
ncbi:MAG TPA: cell envelope integrity protein TolA [Gammaproteobacteria bacterium]